MHIVDESFYSVLVRVNFNRDWLYKAWYRNQVWSIDKKLFCFVWHMYDIYVEVYVENVDRK